MVLSLFWNKAILSLLIDRSEAFCTRHHGPEQFCASLCLCVSQPVCTITFERVIQSSLKFAGLKILFLRSRSCLNQSGLRGIKRTGTWSPNGMPAGKPTAKPTARHKEHTTCFSLGAICYLFSTVKPGGIFVKICRCTCASTSTATFRVHIPAAFTALK